jgi:hypothetical protein
MRTPIYRWIMVFLITLVGVTISFGQGIVYAAAGGFSVPSVNDHFDQPKTGPKPVPQKPISIPKTQSQDQKQSSPAGNEQGDDGPGVWDVTKFLVNDVSNEMAGSVEPYLYSSPYMDSETGNWVDPVSPSDTLRTSLVKIPRSILGNFYFDNGSLGKIFLDTWDGIDKGKEVWDKYKTLKEVNELKGKLSGFKTLAQAADIERKIGKLKTVTKFSKGVAIVGLGVSAVDFGLNAWDTYKAWKAGDSAGVRDSAISAAGSFGEGLMSAGALLGPTPWGIGLAATGAVLWAGSALWANREGIKKIGKTVWNGAKAVGNSIKNGLKAAWHGIFG